MEALVWKMGMHWTKRRLQALVQEVVQSFTQRLEKAYGARISALGTRYLPVVGVLVFVGTPSGHHPRAKRRCESHESADR